MRKCLYLAAMLLLPIVADAQEVTPILDGLVVGAHGVIVSPVWEARRASPGLGAGATIGFGFTRVLGAFLDVELAGLSVGGRAARLFGQSNLGIRVSLPTARRIMPYSEVAFSGLVADLGRDTTATGNAATLGIGIEWFRRSNLSFDFGIRYSHGTLDESTHNGDAVRDFTKIHGSVTRLMVGIRRRPPRSGH